MKEKKKRILILLAVILVLGGIGGYFLLKYQTFNHVESTIVYKSTGTDNANYRHCFEKILKYSRDGIALFADDGKELWNQPCQMSNPSVEICERSAAVGDKGGTNILVFEEKGLKGEIQTTKPIEKFAVSSQGIVSAILKDNETPLVMCYDSMGNKLVEHRVVVKNMGYPVDVSISKNGETLLVSYIHTEGGVVTGKIAYYYFGEGNKAQNYQVYDKSFPDTVIPVTAFLKNNISLCVADNELIFYKGTRNPKESVRVPLKSEIQSVAYSEDLVALVLRKTQENGYKLHIYNTNGKQLSAADVDREYGGLKIVDGQVILYDGQNCSIYLRNGIHKYEGNIEHNIMEIFPISGLNKYMVINAEEFQEIRLAK